MNYRTYMKIKLKNKPLEIIIDLYKIMIKKNKCLSNLIIIWQIIK